MVPPASHRVSRVPWYSGSHLKSSRFSYVAITLYSGAFQLSSLTIPLCLWRVRNPNKASFIGLACSAFARRYLRNHFCFLFLRLLRCFSSPGSLRMAMYSPYGDRSLSCRVAPFRYLRVKAYLQLTAAFRSLSRLSSALGAKSSTLCS